MIEYSEIGKLASNATVDFADNHHNDAFGRLRTSNARTEMDLQQHYGSTHYNFIHLHTAPVVSISLGASALVTLGVAHGLVAGTRVQFKSIGGSLYTGIDSNTWYYVIATGLTSVAFQFSATLGGAAVTTSGTTSGLITVSSGGLVCTQAGVITDTPNNAASILSVPANVGAKVTNRSRRSYYVAGQSHMIAMTFCMQSVPTEVAVVIRSSTSGTPSDANRIVNADWNIDRLDGTGPSGITVDWTKTQIITIDFQWLGVGRVRIGLDINGTIYPIHRFNNANAVSEVYMSTPHLPCSYVVERLSDNTVRKQVGYFDEEDGIYLETINASGDNTLMQICSAVFTEGTEPTSQIKHAMTNGATGIACTNGVFKHLLSIRPSQLFKGLTNKGMALPISIEVFVEGATPAQVAILGDPVFTSETWTSHANSESMMECGIGPGIVVNYALSLEHKDSFYVSGAVRGGASAQSAYESYRMQIDAAGNPDVLSVVAAGLGGTSTCYAVVSWKELY
jgi:hypothetical protein